jgi:hypothetical protein
MQIMSASATRDQCEGQRVRTEATGQRQNERAIGEPAEPEPTSQALHSAMFPPLRLVGSPVQVTRH